MIKLNLEVHLKIKMNYVDVRLRPDKSARRPWYLRCLPRSCVPGHVARVAVEQAELKVMVRVFWNVPEEKIKYQLLADPPPEAVCKLRGELLGCPVPLALANPIVNRLLIQASGHFFDLHLNHPPEGEPEHGQKAVGVADEQLEIEREIREMLRRAEEEEEESDDDSICESEDETGVPFATGDQSTTPITTTPTHGSAAISEKDSGLARSKQQGTQVTDDQEAAEASNHTGVVKHGGGWEQIRRNLKVGLVDRLDELFS